MIRILISSCLVGLWLIVGILTVRAQVEPKGPSDWYCDKRLTDGRAVIIGTVVEIYSANKLDLRIRAKFKEQPGYTISNVIRIRIDKSYRNDFDRYAHPPTEIVVPNLQTSSSQAASLKMGDKFVFYLDALTVTKDDLISFYIDPLGQTRPVSEAGDTISFLEKVYKLDLLKDVLGYDKKDAKIGGIVSGRAVFLPKPKYPDELKKEKAIEAIHVYVLVDETGRVIKAKALCAKHALLAAAAEEASLKSKFSPTSASGRPIKVQGTITYNFVP